MGRFIKNPYLGREDSASAEVTDEWLQGAVKTIANQIINREIDDEEMDDGEFLSPKISALSSSGGGRYVSSPVRDFVYTKLKILCDATLVYFTSEVH